MNNVKYFSYFEAGRIAWLQAMQASGEESLKGLVLGNHKPGVILAETACRFVGLLA